MGRDTFTLSLDDSTDGIRGMTRQMLDLLHVKDQMVHSHLVEKLCIPAECYAIRWLVLMFAQDHDMPDVLRVWDSLLSDTDEGRQLLLYVAVARLILVRRNSQIRLPGMW